MSRLAALSLAATLVVLPACGDSDVDAMPEDRANPVPGSALEPSDFASLPKPGSARPLDAPAETDASITQSFLVSGLGPRGVLQYYASVLPEAGWLPVDAETAGTTTLRSKWRRRGLLLEVTAFAEDGVESAGPTQLDLSLRYE